MIRRGGDRTASGARRWHARVGDRPARKTFIFQLGNADHPMRHDHGAYRCQRDLEHRRRRRNAGASPSWRCIARWDGTRLATHASWYSTRAASPRDHLLGVRGVKDSEETFLRILDEGRIASRRSPWVWRRGRPRTRVGCVSAEGAPFCGPIGRYQSIACSKCADMAVAVENRATSRTRPRALRDRGQPIRTASAMAKSSTQAENAA